MKKMAILLLNYNGKEHCEKFCENIIEFLPDDMCDLFLIDNKSDDRNFETIQLISPDIKIILNDQNYGWAKGYNQGLKKIDPNGNKYQYYMFINNDTIPTKSWLDEILKNLNDFDSEVAEIGCRSLFYPFVIKESPFYNNNKVELKSFKYHYRPGDEMFLQYDEGITNFTMTAYNPTESDQKLEVKSYKFELNNSNNSNLILIPPKTQASIKLRAKFSVDKRSYIIQNSGIGLNHNFDGYDLHWGDTLDTPQSTDISGVCGVCKIVRSSVYHKTKGFDESYFMYYEDLDYSLTLRSKEKRSKIIDSAILYHRHAATSVENSPFFIKQVAASMIVFKLRWGSTKIKIKTILYYLKKALGEVIYRNRGYHYAKNLLFSINKVKIYK